MWLDDGGTILSSALRLTAPLAFAACGEYLAERAGTLNISVEGMMLSGAVGAIAIGSATGSPTATSRENAIHAMDAAGTGARGGIVIFSCPFFNEIHMLHIPYYHTV